MTKHPLRHLAAVLVALLSASLSAGVLTGPTRLFMLQRQRPDTVCAKVAASRAPYAADMLPWQARRHATPRRQTWPETVAITLTCAADSAEAIGRQLSRHGARVHTVAGNVLTASISADSIASVASATGVRRLSVASPVRLCSDRQRAVSLVDSVLQGGGALPQPFTGAGVVVGVIDTGFDFGHLAFRDAAGNTRIRAVYMPCDTTGASPVVDGHILPGSHYTDTADINALTTDYTGDLHGTHTSGIAAGTRLGLYGGMATGADLVLCGLADDLTDAAILNSIRYIFHYADSVGRPAVVNISMSDHCGAHDGNTEFCHAIEALTCPGHIVVMSAGNEGDSPLHFSATLTPDSKHSATARSPQASATVLLRDKWAGGITYSNAQLGLWSADTTAFAVQLVAVDTGTGTVLCASPVMDAAGKSGHTLSTDGDTANAFKPYYSLKCCATTGVDPLNRRFNVSIAIEDARATDDWQGKVMLGLRLTSHAPTTVNGWDEDFLTYFTNGGLNTLTDSGDSVTALTDGDSEMSISALACTDAVVSVGSYTTRAQWQGQYNYSSLHLEDNTLSAFSSYGPDANGKPRPDVVGAGAIVISAVNGYCPAVIAKADRMAASVTDDAGRVHYWADDSGTSMSSPQVAGIIALWLQADPTLTPGDVRQVLQATSARPPQCAGDDPRHWGAGLINALRGMEYVAGVSAQPALPADAESIVCRYDSAQGTITVTAAGTAPRSADVFAADGTLIASASASAQAPVLTIGCRQALPPGLYIVSATTANGPKAAKLLIH